MSPLAAALMLVAQAGEVAHSEATELLEFEYGWPVAARADPGLESLLRERMEAARTRARVGAEEMRGLARNEGFEFRPHYYVQIWSVAGRTAALTSLNSSIETYDGGAHGNLRFEALLWNRAGRELLSAINLLGSGAGRLTPRYCVALDLERADVRGEPVMRREDDPFNSCPPLAEQVLALADRDGDAHFDTLLVLIPPYVAGPYVEGAYPLELPLEPEDLANVPDRYRPAFRPVNDD